MSNKSNSHLIGFFCRGLQYNASLRGIKYLVSNFKLRDSWVVFVFSQPNILAGGLLKESVSFVKLAKFSRNLNHDARFENSHVTSQPFHVHCSQRKKGLMHHRFLASTLLQEQENRSWHIILTFHLKRLDLTLALLPFLFGAPFCSNPLERDTSPAWWGVATGISNPLPVPGQCLLNHFRRPSHTACSQKK